MATNAGGPVGVVANVAASTVTTQAAHNLQDGDRVRLAPGLAGLVYVKTSGFKPDAFGAFVDAQQKQPANLSVVNAGANVVRLNLEDFAVVAGINQYPAFSSLNGPVADANRLAGWLQAAAFVPDDQLDIITSPAPTLPPATLANAQPTLDTVKGAFIKLARQANLKPLHRLGRRLYIFLSGHGILPTGESTPDFNETALLMANVDSTSLGDHLGGRAYAEWFRAPGVFDEVVLFMDCCRDMKDNISLTPPPMPRFTPERAAGRRFYAAATQLDSKSWERPLGVPPATRGLFSFALMEGLESPLLHDTTFNLTGAVLAKHLYNRVPQLKSGQLPDIDYKPEQDIVFLSRPNTGVGGAPTLPQVNISFAPEYVGKTADLVGPKNYPAPQDSHVIDGTAWTTPLSSALYKLVIRETGESKQFEVFRSKDVQDVHFP